MWVRRGHGQPSAVLLPCLSESGLPSQSATVGNGPALLVMSDRHGDVVQDRSQVLSPSSDSGCSALVRGMCTSRALSAYKNAQPTSRRCRHGAHVRSRRHLTDEVLWSILVSVKFMAAVAVLAVFAVAACGGGTPEPTATPTASSPAAPVETASSGSEPSEPAVVVTQVEVGDPDIREMSEAEWALYSSIGDDGMVCPQPNASAGDAFWDYDDDFAPAEFGRQPGDALADAVTELNDDRQRDADIMGIDVEDILIPETGWVGLTHKGDGTVYFVFPEVSWEYIVIVGGDPATGVWRHLRATVCSPAM